MAKIDVKGTSVTVISGGIYDYISLTDIARYKDSERTDYIIQNWLRNRNTIEFMGIWEQLNNSDFNPIEFDGIKIRVVELLPDAHEFDGVPVPEPVLDDVVGAFTVLVAGDVRERNVIVDAAGYDGNGRAFYVDFGHVQSPTIEANSLTVIGG